jgi:hypothetical protein
VIRRTQPAPPRATRPGAARRVLALHGAFLVGWLALTAARGDAVVFHAKDEALNLAFPNADRVEARDFFLTPEQRREIEQRAQAPLTSELVTIYVGHRGDAVSGYAIFDTHTVRTLPETFLVVLTPTGAVAATHVLAFYEPLEYLPPGRWLEQFDGRGSGSDLRVGNGIAAITGSTLTSHAVSSGIGRALALFTVLLDGP